MVSKEMKCFPLKKNLATFMLLSYAVIKSFLLDARMLISLFVDKV